MDMASVASIFTTMHATREALSAALGVRDFNAAATHLSRLNEMLLKAQDALLRQNATLFEMQSKNFEMAQELAKLKEAQVERSRYTLVEVHQGSLAYRVNVVPDPTGAGDPSRAEPPHYVCQSCLDKPAPRKVVLQSTWHGRTPMLWCPACGTNIRAGETRRTSATAGHRILSPGL